MALTYRRGLHGFFLTAAVPWQRAFLILCGMSLIKPGVYTDLAGAAFAVIVIGAQIMARRAAAETARPAQ